MYFHALDKRIQDAIINLTKDDVFQERFGTDPILDSIENLKENLADEYKGIMAVIRNSIILNGKEIKCITPAVWSFLWVTESPFITGDREPNDWDVNFLLYLLFNGIENGDTIALLNKSQNYYKDVLNWTFEEALTLIKASILYSFKPLQLFPQKRYTW